MKYTREDVVHGKKVWRFNCPKDVSTAGVAKTQTFYDGRVARFEIPKLIHLVELYRKGVIKEGKVGINSLMVHLMNHFIRTDYYRELSGSTQKQYEAVLGSCLTTPVKSKTLGNTKVTKVDARLCRDLYAHWAANGSANLANTKARILSVLLNYAVSLELLVNNPIAKVRKLKYSPDTRIWTQGEVEKLLEVGYQSFDLRNVTLLAHMCYEYAQRPAHIARLTWDKLDFDTKCITIRQGSCGSTVYLPIEEPLLSLLLEQKEAWGFQPYVVPHQIPSGSHYHIMKRSDINSRFSTLKDKAGLDSDLHLRSLRNTAIIELVEAGVDAVGIMNVSGHKKISSLTPYIKPTLKNATTALSQRRKL